MRKCIYGVEGNQSLPHRDICSGERGDGTETTVLYVYGVQGLKGFSLVQCEEGVTKVHKCLPREETQKFFLSSMNVSCDFRTQTPSQPLNVCRVWEDD